MPISRPTRPLTVALAAAALLLSGCAGGGGGGGGEAGESGGVGTRGGTQPTGGAPVPVAVSEELQPYYQQELSWRACAVAGFQCATLTVPLDYDAIDTADDLQLAVARVRATGPGDRAGSLLVNPGGPGASAIDFLQGHAGRGFPAPVRARYDVVALDPRGTGRSEPVECLADAEMDAFTAVDRTPDDAAEAEALTAAFTAFGESCREKSGRLLEHISTEESARDLDVLRAVLGDEQLHYYGASYGTYLGAVYAGLFPGRTGRLVLDAAVDPRLSTLDTDREQAGGFETALESFLADCAAGGGCPVADAGELRDLFAQLDAEPLPTGDGNRPLTEALATTGVAQALYTPAYWPNLREALTAAREEGDGSGLLSLSDAYHGRGADGSYGTIMYAFPAISCLDRPAAVEDAAGVERELAAFEEASPTFGADFAWASLLCATWPVPATGGPGAITAPGTGDILVLGTTRDPATPYAWAEGLAEQLGSGVLLTYDGDGHGAYGSDDCVDTAVNTYLLEGTPPQEGTVCS